MIPVSRILVELEAMAELFLGSVRCYIAKNKVVTAAAPVDTGILLRGMARSLVVLVARSMPMPVAQFVGLPRQL